MNARPARWVAAFAALSLLGSACIGRGGKGDPNVLTVAALTGQVQVRETPDATWRATSQGERLPAGAAVRVPTGGLVRIERGDDSSVELRPTASFAEMNLLAAGRVEVLSGDLLVRSARTAPMAVSSLGIEARAEQATFRFDRRKSVRVGVYEGNATVAVASETLPVPTLREGVVAGNSLPRTPVPLAIRSDDPWDSTLLADVIELDRDLAQQARGYEGQYGARTSAADFAELRRALAQEGSLDFVTASQRRSVRSADLLIGIVFTLLLSDGGAGQDAEQLRTLLSLRTQGATWGLLAREFGVRDLLPAVDRAIALRTGDIEPGTPGSSLRPGPGSGGSGGGGSSGGGGGSGGGNGGNGGGGGGEPKPSPTRRPTSSPSPSPTNSGSPSPSPSPSPTPSPTCSLIDELLGNC